MERLEHVIISTTALGLRVASMNGPVAVAGWRKLAAGTVWLQRWWEGGLQHPPQTTNRPSSLTNLSSQRWPQSPGTMPSPPWNWRFSRHQTTPSRPAQMRPSRRNHRYHACHPVDKGLQRHNHRQQHRHPLDWPTARPRHHHTRLPRPLVYVGALLTEPDAGPLSILPFTLSVNLSLLDAWTALSFPNPSTTSTACRIWRQYVKLRAGCHLYGRSFFTPHLSDPPFSPPLL